MIGKRKIYERVKTIVRNHVSGIKAVPLLKAALSYRVVTSHNHKKLVREAGQKDTPDLFNSDGEKMQMVYMAGSSVKYCLTAGQVPRYILWNHWDTALPVHFYGYLDIEEALKEKSTAVKCLFLQESRAIIPRVYEYVLRHPKTAAMFQFIFTSDSEVLEKYQNAHFLPAGGVWYGTPKWGGGGYSGAELYKGKCKNISLLASDKVRCELHRFRRNLAMKYKDSTSVDTFGAFDGGPSVMLGETLEEYRYSIIIENDQKPYYFTEKILNCFATLTVPIYIGAGRIGDFFNKDGILRLEKATEEAVEEAVQSCGEQDYLSRREALFDNYERVREYRTPENYLYTHYKKELFI